MATTNGTVKRMVFEKGFGFVADAERPRVLLPSVGVLELRLAARRPAGDVRTGQGPKGPAPSACNFVPGRANRRVFARASWRAPQGARRFLWRLSLSADGSIRAARVVLAAINPTMTSQTPASRDVAGRTGTRTADGRTSGRRRGRRPARATPTSTNRTVAPTTSRNAADSRAERDAHKLIPPAGAGDGIGDDAIDADGREQRRRQRQPDEQPRRNAARDRGGHEILDRRHLRDWQRRLERATIGRTAPAI